MDLDWCTEEDLLNTSKFNENSIISKNLKNFIEDASENNEFDIKSNIDVKNCFSQNLNINNPKDLLNILNYLSLVSNYLRTLIRNKNNKYNDINQIDIKDFELLLKYLDWLKNSCIAIKIFFAVPLRKDNSYDPNNIKLFKTSSYKFCNFKESCSIHRNKNKTCDKNHFVFDMIINDIEKLINSINLLELDNFNWIISNKSLLITYNADDKNYFIEKLPINVNNYDQLDNQFIIDKILVFKSFDVVSFVLNKMYEEAFSFLNFNLQSFIIYNKI